MCKHWRSFNCFFHDANPLENPIEFCNLLLVLYYTLYYIFITRISTIFFTCLRHSPIPFIFLLKLNVEPIKYFPYMAWIPILDLFALLVCFVRNFKHMLMTQPTRFVLLLRDIWYYMFALVCVCVLQRVVYSFYDDSLRNVFQLFVCFLSFFFSLRYFQHYHRLTVLWAPPSRD